MIITLKGGLGNQLFEYAYGRRLELSGKKIRFDTSFFHGNKAKIDTARDFKLDKFNIETKAEFSEKKHSFLNLTRKIKRHLGFKFDEYYQNEKYFKNIEKNIRKEFTLKNPLSKTSLSWEEKIKNTENSVSVHIRRGDYVSDKKTNTYHGTCDIKYYKNGLEKITEILQNKNVEIFVFSDDIAWTKENLKLPYQTYFVSSPEIVDYEELILLSKCKNNIIANSSFSWWGAWLNQNNDKIVIAPKQWTTTKNSDELDVLPKKWIQI